MKWLEETCDIDAFYSLPSPDNRPKCIPASWLAACLLHHLQTVDINSFPLQEKINRYQREINSPSACIGHAVFPAISLINHSCDPSTSLVISSGGTAILIARKCLKAGAEISLNYLPHIRSATKRRRHLLSKFYFDCSCEACTDKWWIQADVVDWLNCPDCSQKCSIFERRCSRCASFRGTRMYQNLIDDIEKLQDDLDSSSINLTFFADVLKRAQSLVTQPSQILTYIYAIFDASLALEYLMFTLEPWLTF